MFKANKIKNSLIKSMNSSIKIFWILNFFDNIFYIKSKISNLISDNHKTVYYELLLASL